jgi:transcriptional regulator with XRE-family HTH domain
MQRCRVMALSRIGGALRSARVRAGFSREALAYHSGLSWAAITQIESGRRQEVRVSSLVALANALGVSVDYLVGSEATVSPRLLGHRALIYGSDEEYMASAVPFLLGGIEESESVLAVTTARQIGLLRDVLGDKARHVEFWESSDWYVSPRAALDAYRGFLKERFDGGAPWIRIIGEPVWAGRTRAEIAQWTRYESLINLALGSSPATIVCPYDARALPEPVLADTRRTHPLVTEAPGSSAGPVYLEPEDFLIGI